MPAGNVPTAASVATVPGMRNPLLLRTAMKHSRAAANITPSRMKNGIVLVHRIGR